MNEELEKHIEFIKMKHASLVRRYGSLLYEHPIKVCNLLREKGYPLDYQIAALYQDLLKYTDTTEEEIEKHSSKEIANVVEILTRKYEEDLETYFNRVLLNDLSRMVKVADRIYKLQQCLVLDEEFISEYISESEKYTTMLAEGTVLEEEYFEALNKAKKKVGHLSK